MLFYQCNQQNKYFLNDYILTHNDIGINSEKIVTDRSWHLSGFQTSLALGLKGKIGIHSWGGTKTIEIDWQRRSEERPISKNNKPHTRNENTLFMPQSVYGVSKVSSFYLTNFYARAYKLFACAGILFNHESPRRSPNFVTKKITSSIARVLAGKQKKIELGNINAMRDWGFAGDYMEAVWLMMQQKKPDNFVIATGKNYSVKDFVEYCFKLVNLDWKKYVNVDVNRYKRPAEVDNLLGDSSKARKVLGWKPKVNFEQLCKMMLEHDLKSHGLSIDEVKKKFKDKFKDFTPSVTAGHSLGEYTSLSASNALSVSDTIRLVSERGRLMQIACDKNPGGMVAIIGMEIDVVEEVCREAGAYPSNINSSQQVIISGDNDSLAIAVDLAKARGAKKAIKLSVGGAFHSILMEPARDSLMDFIESLNFSDPEIPLIGNVNAKPLENASQIKNELIEQLMSCVQWNDTIKYMSSNGLNDYIEFGPGKVLTGLIKRIDSNSSTMNIDSYESLNS